MDPRFTGRMISIAVTPNGRRYDFDINGYTVSFMVPPSETISLHPLDILQQDLQSIVNTLAQVDRFRSGPAMLPPGEEKNITLNDLFPNMKINMPDDKPDQGTEPKL